MLKRLSQFITMHFRQSENGLMQILLLNVLCFGGLLLLKTALVLIGYEEAYSTLLRSLVLPGSWSTYLHRPWALFTYNWIHVSFLSTLWGLFLLHALGRIVLDLLSNRHFLILYLLGSLVGGLFFLLICQLSPHFRDTTASLSGFSGSLYAVMAAAATLAPQFSFYFLLLGPIRLKYVVGFLLLVSLIDLSSANATDPSSIAQLGGALLGYSYVKWVCAYPALRQRWPSSWAVGRTWKITYRSTTVSQEKSAHPSDRSRLLDQILDKVAESGYESLTPAEKQQLFDGGK